MNKFLKIFTIVGAGLIIGSVAGKFIRQDKIEHNRMVGDKDNRGSDREGLLAIKSPDQVDDMENIFI
jgi:hypothetical protein